MTAAGWRRVTAVVEFDVPVTITDEQLDGVLDALAASHRNPTVTMLERLDMPGYNDDEPLLPLDLNEED